MLKDWAKERKEGEAFVLVADYYNFYTSDNKTNEPFKAHNFHPNLL